MTAPLDDLMGTPMSQPTVEVEDQDVEISVVDDRPEADQRPPREGSGSFDIDEEIDSVGGGTGNKIKRLKYEYHEERRAKEQAERLSQEAVRYAEHAARENEELKGLLHRGEKVLLSEIKTRADTQLDRARQDYKSAYESGDPEALIKAQESLNQSQIDIEVAKQSGPVVPDPAQQRQQQMQQQQQVQAQQPAPVDPKLQSWLQENDWFGEDEEMTSFAYGVHEKLVRKDGVDPRSDEYYARLNKRLGDVFPDHFEGRMGTEEPAASSRRSAVVAPATRSSGRPRKVQLTSTQVALAKRLGITPEQYAKQLLKEVG